MENLMKNTNLFKLSAIILLACPLFSSAMESEEKKISYAEIHRLLTIKKPLLSDWLTLSKRKPFKVEEHKISSAQIYQLLSFITKDDNHPDFHLPSELVQSITLNAHNIICYEKYGHHLRNANSLVNFIEGQACDGADIQSTVNILELCLDYSGKSLSDIYKHLNMTPLELVISRCKHSSLNGVPNKFVQYCIDVLNQLQ